MNKMEKNTKEKNITDKKEVLQPKVYLILLIILGIVIIFEAVSIVNTLNTKEKLSQTLPETPKLISQPKVEKGTMKITLEEDQEILPNKNLKARILFNSPQEAIAGVDAILTFDPKLISIVDLSGNKEVFSQIVINNQKQKEGRIKITAYQPTKILLGEQLLASLTFRLLENKPANLEIEFLGPEVATDSNLVSQKTQKDILSKVESLKLGELTKGI